MPAVPVWDPGADRGGRRRRPDAIAPCRFGAGVAAGPLCRHVAQAVPEPG